MPDATAPSPRGVRDRRIETGIPLHRRIIVAPDFINGDYDIRWLERFVDSPPERLP